MNLITSGQNPVVKEIKSLKERKYREETGLFFIEGIRFVEEALKEKADIIRILVSEQFSSVKGGKDILEEIGESYTTYMLPLKLFKDISDTENPQGILAVIRGNKYELKDLVGDNSFIVLLDSVQDPGNLGTIIRTADAAGASGIVLSKGCVDIYNPKVLRSTMGSIFHIPICISDSLEDTIKALKAGGIRIYAAHLGGQRNYFELDLKENAAFIIGNEANGIRAEIADCADELVRIPMPGRAESLNASVAAGLLMYEVVRQRQ